VAWDPDRYLRFRQERFAPFDDLFGLVDTTRPHLSVVDLGCGTGELTRRLADRLEDAEVLGVDSSPEMLAESEAFERPGLRFEHGDLARVGGSWDLVVSNAAIQWVDDHAQLVPHLFGLLAPGGRLGVQVPSNHNHRTHTAIAEVAASERFGRYFAGWDRRWPVLAAEAYGQILWELGSTDLAVFDRIYCHELADAAAMVDWVRATAMRPYLERLPADLHEAFVSEVTSLVTEAFPGAPVLLTFRRTFFAATKADRT